jgi:subtilisin family serine protease
MSGSGVVPTLSPYGVRDGRGLRPLVATALAAGLTAALTAPAGAAPGVSRVVQAEPALAVAPLVGRPFEWQFAATREDRVPAWVLRAAASVTVAVVDTGADLSAPDLAAKAPATFASSGSGDVRDTNGHGTFVAALAAGSSTNGEGIAGFGGDARLVVVKAGSGDGSFTDIQEANAIVYAVDHGARIVNLSMGGTETSATERRAIDYAVGRGALIVAAAGNDYDAGNPTEYPAALLPGKGLAVAASTAGGARAAFSNTGSYVSLAAPGERVFSAVSSLSSALAYPRVRLPGSRGLYGYASGTSFAAAEVSGAAALVWAANPLLTAAQVADVLQRTAAGGRWTPTLGYGVLDVARAVAEASAGAASRRSSS